MNATIWKYGWMETHRWTDGGGRKDIYGKRDGRNNTEVRERGKKDGWNKGMSRS